MAKVVFDKCFLHTNTDDLSSALQELKQSQSWKALYTRVMSTDINAIYKKHNANDPYYKTEDRFANVMQFVQLKNLLQAINDDKKIDTLAIPDWAQLVIALDEMREFTESTTEIRNLTVPVLYVLSELALKTLDRIESVEIKNEEILQAKQLEWRILSNKELLKRSDMLDWVHEQAFQSLDNSALLKLAQSLDPLKTLTPEQARQLNFFRTRSGKYDVAPAVSIVDCGSDGSLTRLIECTKKFEKNQSHENKIELIYSIAQLRNDIEVILTDRQREKSSTHVEQYVGNIKTKITRYLNSVMEAGKKELGGIYTIENPDQVESYFAITCPNSLKAIAEFIQSPKTIEKNTTLQKQIQAGYTKVLKKFNSIVSRPEFEHFLKNRTLRDGPTYAVNELLYNRNYRTHDPYTLRETSVLDLTNKVLETSAYLPIAERSSLYAEVLKLKEQEVRNITNPARASLEKLKSQISKLLDLSA